MLEEIINKGNIITGFHNRQEKLTAGRKARELASKLTNKLSMIRRNTRKDGEGTPKQKRIRFGKKESSIESNNSISKDELKKSAKDVSDNANKRNEGAKSEQSEVNKNKEENINNQKEKQKMNLKDSKAKDENENKSKQTITLDLPDILEDIAVKPYENK